MRDLCSARSAAFTRPKSCNVYKLYARDFKDNLETFKSLTVYKTSDLLALGFPQVEGWTSSYQQHIIGLSIRDSGECFKPLVVSNLMSCTYSSPLETYRF